MEELVAELNAAFLSADLGLTPWSREEHAAYIAGLHGSSSGSAQPLSQRKRKRAAAIRSDRPGCGGRPARDTGILSETGPEATRYLIQIASDLQEDRSNRIGKVPQTVTQNTSANATLPVSRMPTTTPPCQRRSSGSVSSVIGSESCATMPGSVAARAPTASRSRTGAGSSISI
jgi:hypothetical protein